LDIITHAGSVHVQFAPTQAADEDGGLFDLLVQEIAFRNSNAAFWTSLLVSPPIH